MTVAVGAADLVAAWAAAASREPAWPSRPDARVAELVAALIRPGGERAVAGELTSSAWDRALLQLVGAAGDPARRLDGVARCRACGQLMDVSMEPPEPPAPTADAAAIVLRIDGVGPAAGCLVTARVPTLADLDAALAAAGAAGRRDLAAGSVPPDGRDLAAAVAALVDRVVVELADDGGSPLPPAARAAALGDGALLAALDRAVREAEPVVVDPVELTCPECGDRWAAVVALDEFAWTMTGRAARALLDEVHRLAAAYGWTHDAVLALPVAVRREYLERSDDAGTARARAAGAAAAARAAGRDGASASAVALRGRAGRRAAGARRGAGRRRSAPPRCTVGSRPRAVASPDPPLPAARSDSARGGRVDGSTTGGRDPVAGSRLPAHPGRCAARVVTPATPGIAPAAGHPASAGDADPPGGGAAGDPTAGDGPAPVVAAPASARIGRRARPIRPRASHRESGRAADPRPRASRERPRPRRRSAPAAPRPGAPMSPRRGRAPHPSCR